MVSLAFFIASCSVKYVKHDIQELPKPLKIPKPGVTLVLGGGGSRGVAHLGVISALEDYNIPIDMIVGTSAGSIVGALYAEYADSDIVENILAKHELKDFIDFSYFRGVFGLFDITAPITGDKLEKFMAHHLLNDDFSKVKIPLVITATDLNEEKSLTIGAGKISPAVRASSMAPPYFRPTNIYGRLLVDGGVVEPVPVITAMQYDPKVIIAVDISIPGRDYEVSNMLDVTLKSMYTSYYIMSRMQSSLASVTIHPDLSGSDMFQEKFNPEDFRKGREEALKKIPEILKVLKSKGIPLKPKVNYFTINNQ